MKIFRRASFERFVCKGKFVFFVISNKVFAYNKKFMLINSKLRCSCVRIEIQLLKKNNFCSGVIVFVYRLVFFTVDRVRVGNYNSAGIKVGMFVLNAVLNDKKIYRQNNNKPKFYIFLNGNHTCKRFAAKVAENMINESVVNYICQHF